MDATGMTPTDMTSDELARRLAPLHEDCFGWALSCCGWDEPTAEDVLQTAYVRVMSGRARFEGRSSLRTWMFGVIRRVALEARRRRRRDGERGVPLQAVASARASVESDVVEEIIRSESARRLRQALDRLPERQREVLHLVFYEGLSVAEAAEVMGVGVGSARTHYHRGKERMRAMLSEEEAIRD